MIFQGIKTRSRRLKKFVFTSIYLFYFSLFLCICVVTVDRTSAVRDVARSAWIIANIEQHGWPRRQRALIDSIMRPVSAQERRTRYFVGRFTRDELKSTSDDFSNCTLRGRYTTQGKHGALSVASKHGQMSLPIARIAEKTQLIKHIRLMICEQANNSVKSNLTLQLIRDTFNTADL